MIVNLDWFEIHHAAMVGLFRVLSAVRKERKLEEGRNQYEAGFENHIIGAIGEYAVSKAVGKHWHPAVEFLDTDRGDVGNMQVKATTLPYGSLILREHHPDHFDYLLCIVHLGKTMHVDIVGSIKGSDGKKPEFWREQDKSKGVHKAAWFIPQDRLAPF